MVSIATEFPVKPIADRSAFVAQVFAWLRGINFSTVLDDPQDKELESDIGHLRSSSGEELRFRDLAADGRLEAIGFRHDFPDREGRLWRTEAVLRRAAASDNQDLIRLRTECIARQPGAHLASPRKPYLIKMIVGDGWGGRDGQLSVSDEPLWLPDDDESLEIARTATTGHAAKHLPVVYVSATGESTWTTSEDQIRKLAFDLGGIAHVLVEPNRALSFRLRDLTAGQNAYGGALGIILPDRGIVRRLYLGWRYPDVEDLLSAAHEIAVGIRSQIPAVGWDWTELQEQALRRQRERERNRLSIEDTEELYEQEIANLQDRIRQLEGQLAARLPAEASDTDEGILPDLLTKKIGPEIYPGEFTDRLRLAARESSSRADQLGLDRRSKVVFDAIASHLPISRALAELLEDLERATKNPKRTASELTALLSHHGYREKSDNKHIRLEARGGYEGLDAITLPKTPSDKRSLLNLRKQIERTLGLTKLSE